MLDLGNDTVIHCPLGLWVPLSPLVLPPMSFNGCPYTCAAGHFGNTSQEKDYSCSGECNGGGNYCPAATAQPLLCPAGTHLPVGVAGLVEASCIPCAPGTYNPDKGGTRCSACPAGKLSESVSSTECSDCPRGGSCSAEGAASLRQTFTPCPAGTFNPDGGQNSSASCQACAPGKANPIPGSSDQADCRNCSAGFVAAALGSDFCDGCAAGKYQANEGEQTCVECKPGSYCPAGASAALPCAAGTHSSKTNISSAADCTPTVPGSHAPTGSTDPTPCSAGTVQPLDTQPTCVKCDAGKFMNETGRTECHVCVPGSYCAEGASAPLSCREGSYSNATDLKTDVECTPTVKGHYAPAGSTIQTACSPGTVAPNASMATCDKCAAGKYQADGGKQTCVACEPGHFCPSGMSAPLPCEEGSYSTRTDLNSATQCVKTEPGFYATTGSTAPRPCSPGTVQPNASMATCVKCAAGKYQAGEGEQTCETCGAGNYSSNVLSCEMCPVREYCPDGIKREDCPIGSTTEGPGAENSDACGCRKGTFNNTAAPEDSIICTPCSVDMNCTRTGLTLATVPLRSSRWRLSVTDYHTLKLGTLRSSLIPCVASCFVSTAPPASRHAT
eukprot:scaffold23460_cov69-Phaeocystis_antarctica.AAC.4